MSGSTGSGHRSPVKTKALLWARGGCASVAHLMLTFVRASSTARSWSVRAVWVKKLDVGEKDVPETASGLVAVNAPVVALGGAEMAGLTFWESVVWSDVASSV